MEKLIGIHTEKRLLKDWTVFEKCWLGLFTIINIVLFLAWSDSWLGLVSSMTGMLAVVLVAKGKISNYFFGIINVATYGYIAYGYGLYGEATLNWGFYLLANIIGFFMWKKHTKEKSEKVNGEDVYAKRLTAKGWLMVLAVFVLGSLGYAEILYLMDAQQVRIDSMAVVLSVIAQMLMLYRYADQWLLWIAVNVLSIALWVVTLLQTGGNDWTMVVMFAAYLVNSVYGYINWLKISKTKAA